MSDAQDIALPPTDGLNLAEENVVDPITVPDGAETPVSISAPDGAETPASISAPDGLNSTAEGPPQKPWYQLWGGKRKTKKQSRKQKGGKKSKSRGGNKKSRKQKRSAKNKRA
jgi:hypothetical protein